MKFYSELTKNMYESKEACIAAEEEFKVKIAKQKEEKEKKEADKKARKEAVDNAYKTVIAAKDNYNKVLKEYIKDYGTYSSIFGISDICDYFSSLF